MQDVPVTSGRSYVESTGTFGCHSGTSPNGYCLDVSDSQGFSTENIRGAGDQPPNQLQIRRMADITDGTSNTLAVGEQVVECYNYSSWMYGDTSAFSPSNGLNVHATTCCQSQGGNWLTWRPCMSFRSRHPGGMNGLVADGSVHFFADTIDMTAFQRLGTINGGDIVSVP